MSKDDITFQRELLIGALRLSVRLGLASGGVGISELKRLLEIAAYQELSRRGHTQDAMATLLDVSKATIENYSARARSYDLGKASTPFVSPLYERLCGGPCTEADLRDLVPRDGDQSVIRVGLRALVTEGHAREVRIRGELRYEAILPAEEARRKADWRKALEPTEALHLGALAIVGALQAGPMTEAALTQRRGLAPWADRLGPMLAWLVEQGFVENEGCGPEATHRLSGKHLRIDPKGQSSQLRTGLVNFLDAAGDFLVRAVRRDSAEPLGQRLLRFRATSPALKHLIQRHYEQTLELVEEADAPAAGDNAQATIGWFIYQSETEEGG